MISIAEIMAQHNISRARVTVHDNEVVVRDLVSKKAYRLDGCVVDLDGVDYISEGPCQVVAGMQLIKKDNNE